MQIGS
jgi:hypothetical protein